MTVRIAADAVYLEGRCLAEDADALLLAIQQAPGLPIDVSAMQRSHMAPVQILLALKPDLRGTPADPFLAQHVLR